MIVIFFFFQAEDGIRDKLVTGVQTCALPISHGHPRRAETAERTAPLLELHRHPVDAQGHCREHEEAAADAETAGGGRERGGEGKRGEIGGGRVILKKKKRSRKVRE